MCEISRKKAIQNDTGVVKGVKDPFEVEAALDFWNDLFHIFAQAAQ